MAMYKGRIPLQLVPLSPRRRSQLFSGHVLLAIATGIVIAGGVCWAIRLFGGH